MYLVLFDCDGTLVDSQNVIVMAMTRAFATAGLTPPTREAVLSIVGLSLPNAIGRLLDVYMEDVSVDDLVAAYREAFFALRSDPSHSEPLFPGARAAVEAFAADEEALVGMATGKSRRGVDAILKTHDLEGRFVTIQTSDSAASKPHPEMVLNAIAQTGVEPLRTVVVGDTSFDVEMARAAGAHAIGVSWGYHPVAALEQAGAARIITDFSQLRAAVGALVGMERAV